MRGVVSADDFWHLMAHHHFLAIESDRQTQTWRIACNVKKAIAPTLSLKSYPPRSP